MSGFLDAGVENGARMGYLDAGVGKGARIGCLDAGVFIALACQGRWR